MLLEPDYLENALHTCVCKGLILLTDALAFVKGAIIDLIRRPQDLEGTCRCNSDVVPLLDDIHLDTVIVNVASNSIEESMDKLFRDAELQCPRYASMGHMSARLGMPR